MTQRGYLADYLLCCIPLIPFILVNFYSLSAPPRLLARPLLRIRYGCGKTSLTLSHLNGGAVARRDGATLRVQQRARFPISPLPSRSLS